MKPNQYILASAMFVAAIMAAARPASGPASHRHARFAHRHYNR